MKTLKQFLDDLFCKNDNPYEPLKDTRPYHEAENLKALVVNEVHDILKNDKWYWEYKRNIWRIIKLTVVTVLYIQSLKKANPQPPKEERE